MTEDNRSIVSHAVDWLKGQTFNNVLLVLILLAIGWACHFGMTEALPKLIQQVQNGYQVIDTLDRAERERDRQFYDKVYDRLEGRHHVGPQTPSKLATHK